MHCTPSPDVTRRVFDTLPTVQYDDGSPIKLAGRLRCCQVYEHATTSQELGIHHLGDGRSHCLEMDCDLSLELATPRFQETSFVVRRYVLSGRWPRIPPALHRLRSRQLATCKLLRLPSGLSRTFTGGNRTHVPKDYYRLPSAYSENVGVSTPQRLLLPTSTWDGYFPGR